MQLTYSSCEEESWMATVTYHKLDQVVTSIKVAVPNVVVFFLFFLSFFFFIFFNFIFYFLYCSGFCHTLKWNSHGLTCVPHPDPPSHLTCLGFPGGSEGKESTCSVGDLGSIPGLGRSLRGGNANPLQYSFLAQRSLAGYSPRGCKETDKT